MSSTPRVGVWFAATFTIFFTRALLFSTWLARGPEIKDALGLNTVQMGLFTMLHPLGALLGVIFSSVLVHRFGTKVVTLTTFGLAGAAMFSLAGAIVGGNALVGGVSLVLIGMPMAIADYVGNYEGTRVDKAAKRSVLSAIHGAWGIGMLLGAGLSSLAITAGLSIATHYPIIASVSVVAAVAAAFALPRHPHEDISAETKKQNRQLSIRVWTEKRSLTISLYGFAFIMAETSAGTWVPLALTQTGFSEASAAFAFSIFWVVTTIVRLVGGVIVDAIGRRYTALVSTLVTAVGVTIFMSEGSPSVSYLALVLWGAGMALGFPMAISAMADDPQMAAARLNMIMTVVYLCAVSVGPILGAIGQAVGIFDSFTIPLIFLLISAALSKVTKKEEPVTA